MTKSHASGGQETRLVAMKVQSGAALGGSVALSDVRRQQRVAGRCAQRTERGGLLTPDQSCDDVVSVIGEANCNSASVGPRNIVKK